MTPFHRILTTHPSTCSSLDIAAVLAQGDAGDSSDKLELLATSPSFTDTSSDSDGDCNLEDWNVPPFPKDRRPPIFIIQDLNPQMPFGARSGIAHLNDAHGDEPRGRNVLSAPTIPRMNVLMKEPLFIQAWVENLTLQGPPMHVPWTSDTSVPRRIWIPEGYIFPAGTAQLRTKEIRQSRTAQLAENSPSESKRYISSIRCQTEAPVIPKEHSGDLIWSEPLSFHAFGSVCNAPIHGRNEKCAQHSSGVLIPKPCSYQTINRLSCTCRDVSHTLPQLGSGLSLAGRRGKKVHDLQLLNVNNMEYPDVPTPFRSPVWSAKFNLDISGPDEIFTDHDSMISSLRSHYAALSSGISSPATSESKGVSTDLDVASKSSSSSDDEWAFERDLSIVTEDFQGPVDSVLLLPPSVPEIVPNKPRTPKDCWSDKLDLISPVSPPGLQSEDRLVNISSAPLADSPSAALPRLVSANPSSSTHAGGILKKVKSIRFEDIISGPDASPPTTPTRKFSAVVKHPSPLRNSFTALSLAASDDTRIKSRPKRDQVSTITNPLIFKSKLAPNGTILKSRCASDMPILKRVDANARHEISPASGLNNKSTTFILGRNNHVGSANNENGQAAITQGRARRPWSTAREKARRIEEDGAAPKNRHSTPLRNIFKFK